MEFTGFNKLGCSYGFCYILPNCHQVFHIRRQDRRGLEREPPGRKTLRSPPREAPGGEDSSEPSHGQEGQGAPSVERLGATPLALAGGGGSREEGTSWCNTQAVAQLAGWHAFCWDEAILADPPRGLGGKQEGDS